MKRTTIIRKYPKGFECTMRATIKMWRYLALHPDIDKTFYLKRYGPEWFKDIAGNECFLCDLFTYCNRCPLTTHAGGCGSYNGVFTIWDIDSHSIEVREMAANMIAHLCKLALDRYKIDKISFFESIARL